MSFKEFSFSSELLDALDSMGFEQATPIQKDAIPIILDNKDLIACAQTGTGKTGAFLLPILSKISQQESNNKINTLIIAPTRELALQIDQQIEGFGYFLGVSSLPVYGGGDSSSWEQQKKALTKGADIIVATPGRLIAHMNMGYVKLQDIKHFILDEADRMMDMGFHDDIMKIVGMLPKDRQTLLFSATMPTKIRQLSSKLLKDPAQINIAISKPAKGVLQGAYLAYDSQKIPLIEGLLTGKKNYPSVIIFTSTKRNVRAITSALKSKGFKALAISSDLEQNEREAALQTFKSKKAQILVATDILARGIDIKEISLVINYEVPHDAEDYVHRIGRTARADSTGVALTFISDDDQYRFYNIEKLIEQEVMKIPLPPELNLGEGPTYEPQKKRGRGKRSYGGNKNRGRNNRNKKKPYNKGKKKSYQKSSNNSNNSRRS